MLAMQTFSGIVPQIVRGLNPDSDIISVLYEKYQNVFPITITRSGATLALGVEPRSTRLEYYLTRGWPLDDARSRLAERQRTQTIPKLMARHKETESEATARKRKSYQTGQKTLAARADIATVNYRKGASLRAGYYVDKVNPRTGELYGDVGAKAALYERQRKASAVAWDRVRSGETEANINTRIEYYTRRGHDPVLAMAMLKDRQTTFSLKRCIAELGEQAGYLRWVERQRKWQHTLKSKSPAEIREITLKKTIRNKRYSAEACRFIEKLLDALGISTAATGVYYAENEYHSWDADKLFFFDFVEVNLGLLIEYNGSSFHPNPLKLDNSQKWNSWINPITKKSADEQQANDDRKMNLARSKFKHVFTVWDTDDHDQKIEEIINQIKETHVDS